MAGVWKFVILPLLIAICVKAQDIFVSNAYSSTTCTSESRNCPNVASALALSGDFDSIYVYPGIYYGTQNMNLCIAACVGLQGVKIIGLGPASEVVFSSAEANFADSIALYIYQNTVTTIANVTFQGFFNTVPDEPNKVGAIEIVESDVLFEDVVFLNNSGVEGGAVHAKSSNITLNNTRFEHNSALLHGGGIMLIGSDALIVGCSFLDNNVTSDPADLAGTGGAVYFVGVNDLTILDSEFVGNRAEIAGGAVYMNMNSNTAAKLQRGKFTARNSLFKDSSVNGQGNCVSSGACNSRGGALFVSGLSTTVENSRFENNIVISTSTATAAQGGAVFSTTGALDIQPEYIGAYFSNCSFHKNGATGQGGALYVMGQRLNLLSSEFTENYVNTVNAYFTDAPSQGGALYFTTGGLSAVVSNVLDCAFTGNVAYSGWGGAIFGTVSPGSVFVQRSVFADNRAYSSYTNSGHGGAVMVASGFNLNMYDCAFSNNTVLPNMHLVPLTYSGSGGAIFAQTTAVNITKCTFDHNLALTGQFDSGSAGGAIMLEDCYPASLSHCDFSSNGAAGYYGYSSFASPGTAGAIYIKFSAARISHNTYTGNWVSAGGNEASIGGAVAVFFEYSSVAKSSEGVSMFHSDFDSNIAYGELCTVPNQAGQGGGLAVVGAAAPAVYLSHVNFTNNLALTATKRSGAYRRSNSVSLGGALSIALSSNITVFKSVFDDNLAYNGAGNDISSISGQSNQQNFIHATDSVFIAGTRASQTQLTQQAALTAAAICVTLEGFAAASKAQAASAAPRSHAASAAQRHSLFLEQVPLSWQARFERREVSAHVKRARWQYLRSHDQSLLQVPGARDRVNPIVDQILLLDVWSASQTGTLSDSPEAVIAPDEGYASQSPLGRPTVQYTPLGRRAVRREAREAKASSQAQLEKVYRRHLYLQLDAEFQRLQREQRQLRRSKLASSGKRPESDATWELEEDLLGAETSASAAGPVSATAPTNPATVLQNFHPYVVITSGKAYFENPTFRGVYHMFFGDFPQIAEYAYDNAFLFNTIVAVPSYSAIFGHITQDDLTITALTASIEIFDSNDNSNYTVHQVNLFNATLQLNRNVTVTGGSFVTDSLITGVSADTSSLIPYVAGGDTHPFVTFTDSLYTGVSLQAILESLGSLRDRSDPSVANATDQTVVTLNSATVVVQGKLISDSPIENTGSLNIVNFPTRLETSARFVLTDGALIKIDPSGTMVLLADTYIDAATPSSPAVLNLGRMELLGRTKVANYTRSGKLDTAPFSKAASMGSLASRLVVHGDFAQSAEGSTTLFLNRTSQSAPAMYLMSSANYSGTVFVDFYINSADSIYPDLQLYDGDPSQFLLVAFKNRYSQSQMLSEKLTLHAQSPGLQFGQTVVEVIAMVPSEDTAEQVRRRAGVDAVGASSANATSLYAWGVQVENIACPQINQYYYGVPEQDKAQSSAPNSYACYVCLQNSSCSLCNPSGGSGAGMCAAAGGCGAAGVAFSDSCCDGGCNGQYGTCEVNSDHTSFHCDCSKTIWYTGNNCKELSPEAYVVIFSCVSFLITVALMVFFYYRSLQQKRIVLDELADGLLNHQTEGVNSEYIQYMQQALILNDVFVKWDEITLEGIVGEGSFGVVHKATFRGAQVAVKQMRSMFTELTDKEIEEFRKEAYVMSRLRHPNIVLVMGISLVDQEPVALPKSRSQNISADMFDSANPHLADGKKSKPQKTVCIITEFLDQGSLADILYGPTKLPAEIWTYELVLTCALQAARGMLYLHSHQPPICHRDLKSSNLVVDDHWVVKVTDFGMSRIVPENVQDRDKGIVSPSGSTASHPMGPRKFSLGSSPNPRKFSLGWTTQASGSLQSPTLTTHKTMARSEPPPPPAPEVDHDLEYPGERASIATVDSVQDHNPSMGADSVGGLSHPSLYSKSSHRGNASRLSNFNPEMTSNLGTTAWCAPEVLVSGNKTRYTVKVDVYSFGLVLWELWEKKRPFEELTSRFDIMDAVRAGKRPDISANCPPSYRSLIQRCWQAEPSRRPMFKYIVRYLKDELARVKRQKGGALYNPYGMRPSGGMRPSEGDVEPRRSGSNFSGAGAVISDAAEAAAEFFRKSFSFRGSFAGTQQATSPPNTHRPWTGGNRDDVYVHNDSAHNVLAALSAAARRNEDGTLRISDTSTTTVSASASARASAAASSAAGGTGTSSTGTGTGGNGNGRASEVSGGARPSEAVPVKVPEGRSPLVTAVTSERSLSYLTESPAPFSHMQAINRQPNRLPGAATAGAKPQPAPTPAPKNANNRWRDRYVMNFSGWAPTNPDSGLPPSLASPAQHSSPAMPGFGLPPTRPSTSPIPADAASSASADINYNPLNRSGIARTGASSTMLSRNNSNVSEPSSVASSPKRPGGAVASAAAQRDDEMFILDEDERKL